MERRVEVARSFARAVALDSGAHQQQEHAKENRLDSGEESSDQQIKLGDRYEDLSLSNYPNIRALIIRIRFWGPVYCNYNKEPPK